jgi:rRNA maturation protein Nop10
MKIAYCACTGTKEYTLGTLCTKCKKPTRSAHYKYKDLIAPHKEESREANP